MRNEYFIIILLILGFTEADKSCYLKNGEYEVVYDKQFSMYSESVFIIANKNLTVLKNDQKSEYEIDWINDDQFRLSLIDKQIDSLTDIQQELKSLGEPYYQITGCKDGNVSFEFRHNAHVIINSGKLIRKN